jgi:alkanesulfonate monooxygenase SsuD/methylene tetrahydromethanopterin reductase-like flavin-dependent oxidoreductase (luciferase family)
MAVGLGADEKEAEAFRVPLKQRGAMLEEGIEVLRLLWSGSQVSHHGKHFSFDNITLTPRPAKKIDIWIGGRSEAALRRVARVADGWFASFVTPQEFADGVAKIAEYAAAYGRINDEIEAGSIVFCHVDPDGKKARQDFTAFFAGNQRRPPEQMLSRSAVGTPEECREILQRYVQHGLSKFALWPACPPSRLIQQLAFYAQELIPAFEQREAPVVTV